MDIREHFSKVFHVNVWQHRETGDIEAEIYRADQGSSTSDGVRSNHVLIESFAFVYGERHLIEHLRK
ncbi:hypothetical protein CIW54_07725 [Paraburkholderia sp. T12-10]|nr:hypothetical protein CIW54_07725 [Paraburkholderia sp. T12-10]